MSDGDLRDGMPVSEPEWLGRRWTWRRVDPGRLMQRRPRHAVAPTIEEHLREPVGEQGWALVDVATGEPVLLVDDGYGSPEVAGGLPGPVADLLARAPNWRPRCSCCGRHLRR